MKKNGNRDFDEVLKSIITLINFSSKDRRNQIADILSESSEQMESEGGKQMMIELENFARYGTTDQKKTSPVYQTKLVKNTPI